DRRLRRGRRKCRSGGRRGSMRRSWGKGEAHDRLAGARIAEQDDRDSEEHKRSDDRDIGDGERKTPARRAGVCEVAAHATCRHDGRLAQIKVTGTLTVASTRDRGTFPGRPTSCG